jgi:cell division protein FtsW (lipid II flippase)
MLPSDKINGYVSTVCQQIRWKKARSRVAEEMTHHIVDGRDSYMARGMDEKTAAERAVAETGDAAVIGARLDRIHRPKPQWGMLAAAAGLLTLGILVRLLVFPNGDNFGFFTPVWPALVCAGIGIAGMIAAYFIDFTIIGKYPTTIYLGIMLISVAMLLVPPVIRGYSFYAQYSSLLFPLAFSAVIFAAGNRGYSGVVLCGLAFVLQGFIALYISSMVNIAQFFFHFAIVDAALLGIAVYKKWFGVKRVYGFLLVLAFVAVLAAVFFVNRGSYWDRHAAAAFNPYIDPKGSGYWGVTIRGLLDGAALFGRGDISGEYLAVLTDPTAYTDLLLTALISLFGWGAFAVVLGALLFFMAKGFARCFKQRSSLGLFVSAAIMMTFCVQAIGYVVYNLGFTLISPFSLPLISYGNTATVINLVLIGFMLSVFRTGDEAGYTQMSAAGARDSND